MAIMPITTMTITSSIIVKAFFIFVPLYTYKCADYIILNIKI